MGGIHSFKGKTVLITGAAGGVGAAVAHEFARLGASRLLLVDRDSERGANLKKELEIYPDTEVRFFGVDLCDAAATAAMVDEIQELSIQVLVNNAGMVLWDWFASMAESQWRLVVETNLISLMRLTSLLLPRIPSGGVLVNIASGCGLAGQGGMAAYCASKFGVVGFSESLEEELRPRGIRVLCFCPAFIQTGIVENSMAQKDLGTPVSRIEKGKVVLSKFGHHPERFARKLVDSVQGKKSGVVVDGVVRLLLWFKFFCRPGFNHLRGWIFKAMVKKGLLS